MKPMVDSGGDNSGVAAKLAGLNLHLGGLGAERYVSMWYHDGSKAMKAAPFDIHMNYADGAKAAPNDGDETGVVWKPPGGWVPLLDKDGDPMYGDLGVVNASGDDAAANFVGNADVKCSTDDGGKAKTGADKTDGSACDVEDVEIETEVTFTDNFGDHACSVTRTYTITCDWDASGEVGVGRAATPADMLTGNNVTNNAGMFLTCKVG